MLLLLSFYVTCTHPLISSLACLQIIELYVLIQDKTEVLQSSYSRLNSGENISKQVKSYAFPKSLILLPWFFSETLF